MFENSLENVMWKIVFEIELISITAYTLSVFFKNLNILKKVFVPYFGRFI